MESTHFLWTFKDIILALGTDFIAYQEPRDAKNIDTPPILPEDTLPKNTLSEEDVLSSDTLSGDTPSGDTSSGDSSSGNTLSGDTLSAEERGTTPSKQDTHHDTLNTTTQALDALKGGITDVVIDGRMQNEGALFIPLKGEYHDGHDYIAQAHENGCIATLAEEAKITQIQSNNIHVFIVKDTTTALIRMALFARKRTQAHILAVTGSVGKTSTKDMLIHAFSQAGKTYGTKGNLNNHIGLPLSLTRMPQDCDFGVFEIGMNHKGEISVLTQLLKPELAIITEVAPAHTQFFNSVQDIADAKAEIFEGVPNDGCIILPRDNEYFDYLLQKAHAHHIKHIVTFGYHDESHAQIQDYINAPPSAESEEGQHPTVSAHLLNIPLSYPLNIKGEHQAKNSLSVLLALHFFHVLNDETLASFKTIPLTKGRGDFIKHNLTAQQGAITILDESYNASPAAMNAAIHMLSVQHQKEGRKIAILGDMKELGMKSLQYHIDIAKLLNTIPSIYVIAVGHHIKIIEKILDPKRLIGVFSSSKECKDHLKDLISPSDMILVKGSNSMHMKIIVEELQTL